MERGKKITTEKVTDSSLKVVVAQHHQARIEQDIEKNIKKIRSLIKKLRPSERQKYFDGLLAHMLDEPAETTSLSISKKSSPDKDYSRLSIEELKLIEELSVKMEQLYRTMDHDLS